VGRVRSMKKFPVWAVVLMLCAVALARAVEQKSEPPVTAAVVERAVDGDTVVLVGGERVRYIGVDTPELHHPRKPVQPYAREAMEFNRRLVEGKKVRLELDVEPRDKYGRTLAYVFLEDGRFVNAELLKEGYAQLLTIPPNVRYADLFVGLQKQAREAKRGLWGRK